MKAYLISDNSNGDLGEEVTFAKTAREAKANAKGFENFDNTEFIDLRVKRCPSFDGCENYTEEQIALKQWHDGWFFFDNDDVPDVDSSATDEEFLKAYFPNYKKGEKHD